MPKIIIINECRECLDGCPLIDEKYQSKSHYIPAQDYIEKEEVNSIVGILKSIIKPQPVIKHIQLSNPDFYPAYKDEREWRSRAEKEVRELREELHERRTEYMKEKDKLQSKIYELEEENRKLNELVKSGLGQYL
jgi:wyosine [tRNA(Phe)-imidazoG37] synthetase (radical SAM superfamily)